MIRESPVILGCTLTRIGPGSRPLQRVTFGLGFAEANGEVSLYDQPVSAHIPRSRRAIRQPRFLTLDGKHVIMLALWDGDC